jgi:hypothetical protein
MIRRFGVVPFSNVPHSDLQCGWLSIQTRRLVGNNVSEACNKATKSQRHPLPPH